MESTKYVFVTKDGKIYKKDIYDRSKSPWDVYDPKIGLWIAEEAAHPEFKQNDYISMEKAYSIKKKLDAAVKPKDKTFNTSNDFVGEYIYFDFSGTLYKVRNYRLDSDKYLGHGNWKENASRLTLVGVKNNRVNKEEAAKRMREIDELTVEEIKAELEEKPASPAANKSGSAFNGIIKSYIASTTKDKVIASPVEEIKAELEEKPIEKVTLEGKFVGKYFMDKNRLIKTTAYQNTNHFKDRYHCSKYIGHGIWQHIGFFSGSKVAEKIISDERAAEIMKELDDVKVPEEIANLEVDSNPSESFYKEDKDEVITYTSKGINDDVEAVNEVVEDTVQAFLDKHYLEQNAEVNTDAHTEPETNKMINVTLNENKTNVEAVNEVVEDIEEDLVGKCFRVPEENKVYVIDSVVDNDAAFSKEVIQGMRGTVNDKPRVFKVRYIKNLIMSKDEAYNYMNLPKADNLGDASTLETSAANTIASPAGVKHKRPVIINVPLAIRENETINVWIEHTLKSCTVEEIIDSEDYNVIVEGARVGALTKLFSTFKNLPISDQRMTELIQAKLEEFYMKLKVNNPKGIEGIPTTCTGKYLYLSKSELEKSFELRV